MNFYLFFEVKKGGGGALVHVYVLEHIVSALELQSPVTRGEWLFAMGELISHLHSRVRESLIMYLIALYNPAFELESIYSIYLIVCVIFF